MTIQFNIDDVIIENQLNSVKINAFSSLIFFALQPVVL